MKLNPTRIEQALSQFAAQQVPEDHPVIAQFNRLFGDHTFFIDADGLAIVEPNGRDEGGAETGRIVKLASWVDDRRTLAPHDREFTEVVVIFSKAA